MLRKFKITCAKRADFGQTYDGLYLTDGSGDARVMTSKGSEVIYAWEFKVITY